MFPISKFKTDLLYSKLTSQNFTVKQSRYTYTIIREKSKVNYSDSSINFKVFHILKRLKKSLDKNLGFFSLFDYDNINYNLLNEDFNKGEKYVKIDIKSAYLNTLNNTGFLCEEIYKEINELPKKDRLVVLGLLAYQPDLFYFENGEFVNYEKIKNEYRNVFFFCALQTGLLMKKIADELKNDFVFFWVDGVYIVNTEENIKIATELIKENKFNYTVDSLTDFKFEKTHEGIFFNYKEKGEEKEIHLINEYHKKAKRIKEIMLDVKNLKSGSLRRLMNIK